MSQRYCIPTMKRYRQAVKENSDADLEEQLFEFYPELDDFQIRRADYRHWRRCLIREALRRGMITEDPGFGPPERS